MEKNRTVIPPSSSYIKTDCPYLRGGNNTGFRCLHPVPWLEHGQYGRWLLKCCGDYTKLDGDISMAIKVDKEKKFIMLVEEMGKQIYIDDKHLV